MPTLDDLLTPRNRETIEALLLSTLQGEKFPVTDWYAGGVAKTMLKMTATGLLDRETIISYIAAGGFLDLAAELEDPDGQPIEEWLEMLADQKYDCQRQAAAFTRKRLTMSCASGCGPYTRGAGEFRAISEAGNYYVNVDAATVPDGGSVDAVFRAESPGIVIDATGTINRLSTPLPGLSVVDRQEAFSTPVRFWVGTGSIAPTTSAIGLPTPARTYKVTITQTGRLSDHSAAYSVTVYVAGTVTTYGPYQMSAATFVNGDVTLTFSDGPSGTNSFIGGDTWFVSTPGEPTIQTGSEKESVASLVQRCRDRMPALSAIPTEGKYAAWVRQCSVENALGITRVVSSPSTQVAGVLNIYVADASGAATPTAVQTLQNYIDKRTVDIERANVVTARAHTIVVSGTAYVKRSRMASVKKAANDQWNAYLAGIPIGGEMPGHLVRVSRLDQILENVGVYNSEGLQINSGGTDVDFWLDADEVPAASANGTGDLTWVEIP